MKFCERCGVETERYATKNKHCRPCALARAKRRRERHPEEMRAQDRRRYRANQEKRRAQDNLRRKRHPERQMLTQARSRARKAGVECTITVADIVIPERCPWLGIPLVQKPGKSHDGTPSLDRIIPEIGYVRGNVIVISQRANTIKNNATPEQLARVLERGCAPCIRSGF